MDFLIALNATKLSDFLRHPNIRRSLRIWKARGNGWRIWETGADCSDEDIIVSDDERAGDWREARDLMLIGIGNKSFPGAAAVFQDPEAFSIPYLEMLACHYLRKPFVIGSNQKIILRESIEDDFEQLYGIFAQAEVPMFDRMDISDKTATKNMFSRYVENQYALYGYGIWTTIVRATGEVAGWCGFGTAYEQPDLGYIIRPDLRNRHFAYDACRMALNFAGEELGMEQVMLVADADNKPSLSLANKLGFCEEKRENSCIVLSLSL